eukprot:GEMP01011515.1.p1 GENE.GEMP01011515.1~~GEMP01011515.1.p1  ORF type:complete len:298 (+),score=49.79 GEMP01011515.1:760-1653(+)
MENQSPKSTVSIASSKKRQLEKNTAEGNRDMTDIDETENRSCDEEETESKKVKNNEGKDGKTDSENGKKDGSEESKKCDGSLGSVIRNTTKDIEANKLRIKGLKAAKLANRGKSTANTTPEHESETTNPTISVTQTGGEGKRTSKIDAIAEEESEHADPALERKNVSNMNDDDDIPSTEIEKMKEKENENDVTLTYERAFDGELAKGLPLLDPEECAGQRKNADHKVMLEEMSADSSLHIRISEVMFARKMNEINDDLKGKAKTFRPATRDFGCTIKLGIIAYVNDWMNNDTMEKLF